MAKKINLEKASPDIAREKLAQFKKLFPEAVAEGKIDIEALRRTIGEELAVNDERYTLNWAGKNEAFKALQTPTMATLAPCPEESVDFEKTGNVFIEGENLEVLKVLQKAYYGKIKMIYIDPPYNTGSDSFIYPDRFQESKEEYLKRIEEKDEEGYLLKEGLFRKNSKENGHYHSNWLSMMYPRLFLARNLLREDGVIFVSIDDNEVHNLRLLMNEIFGEENFIASIIWEKKFAPQNDAKWLSDNHDYVLLYAKNKEQWRPNLIARTDQNNQRYSNPDNDPRGPWASGDFSVKTYSEAYDYPITTPSGKIVNPTAGRCWATSKANFGKLVAENRVWFGKDGSNVPRIKTFLSEVQQGLVPLTIWKHQEVGHNQEGRQELKEVFDDIGVFDGPKPTRLLKRMLEISTSKDGNNIILDFFAGSATTAHAIMELNKDGGGNRQFICAQLSEKTDEDTEAFKAGYKTIAEIGKERIRRVIKKIKTEGAKPSVDLGFKVFKLKNSNFKIWRGDVIDTTEDLERQMDMLKDPVKPDAQERNLLWELMLKSGYDLNTPVEEQKIGKYKFYIVAGGEMIVLLSKANEKCLQEIINRKPQKVVCLDSIFEGNDQLKTNTVLQMKDAGIEFRTI